MRYSHDQYVPTTRVIRKNCHPARWALGAAGGSATSRVDSAGARQSDQSAVVPQVLVSLPRYVSDSEGICHRGALRLVRELRLTKHDKAAIRGRASTCRALTGLLLLILLSCKSGLDAYLRGIITVTSLLPSLLIAGLRSRFERLVGEHRCSECC